MSDGYDNRFAWEDEDANRAAASQHEEFEQGYQAGYANGYAQGRVAGREDARAENRSAPPYERLKGNGWVKVDDALREAYSLPSDASRAYVVRDMTGDIISVLDIELGES